jgi:hypothetical protein
MKSIVLYSNHNWGSLNTDGVILKSLSYSIDSYRMTGSGTWIAMTCIVILKETYSYRIRVIEKLK